MVVTEEEQEALDDGALPTINLARALMDGVRQTLTLPRSLPKEAITPNYRNRSHAHHLDFLFSRSSHNHTPVLFWLRRRKGLHVEDKAVQSATKQRTLARKK